MRGPNSEAPLRNYSTFHQIKPFFASGTKLFLPRYTGIYRELLSKHLENAVLVYLEIMQWKYSFSKTNQKHFCWKTCKVSKDFGCVAGEYFFLILSELRVLKWARFFERSFTVKWMTFFASLWSFWDFLQDNLKLKGKLQIWGFESFIFCSKFCILRLC